MVITSRGHQPRKNLCTAGCQGLQVDQAGGCGGSRATSFGRR